MADTVVVMNHGRLEQVGRPSEIYESPASRFVLGFVGFSNFLRVSDLQAQAEGVACRLAGSTIRVGGRPLHDPEAGNGTQLAIRPERIRIRPKNANGAWANRVEATIRDISYEGSSIAYEAVLTDGQSVIVRAPNQGDRGPDALVDSDRYRPGQAIGLVWGAHDAYLLTR